MVQDVLIARGAMSADAAPRQERLQLPSGTVGWEVVLTAANPTAVDMDLYVYEAAGGSRSRPLCSSEGVGAREVCRLLDVPSGPVLVEIVANGGDGRSDFRLTRRALTGPRMGETAAVAGDARQLQPNRWNAAALGGDGIEFLRAGAEAVSLFQIDGSPSAAGWVVAVSASDESAPFELSAFASDGRRLASAEAVAGYGDLTVGARESGGRPFFVLVSSPSRRSIEFSVGAFPAGAPVLVQRRSETWTASGVQNRQYALALDEGETAVVELEGTSANLAITDSSGRSETIRPQFGSAQQLAWIGDPLANSRYILRGIGGRRTMLIRVQTAGKTLYDRPAPWVLHVHASRSLTNYLVRFGSATAEEWTGWWENPVATRADSVSSGGLRLIQLSAPPEMARSASQAQTARRAVSVQPSAVYLARVAGLEGFHVAVCTPDGRVLDIGTEAVRWEWSGATGALYLAVFPDPGNPEARGGRFQIELTRSLLERSK
jgi:hypothetical protein